MATTAPIVIPVDTPGLLNLQKMERKMKALEAQVEKLTKDLDRNTQATKRNGKAAATATGNIQRFGVAFRSTLGPVVALYGAIRVLNGALGTLASREADTAVLTRGLEKLGGTSADLARLQKQADKFGDSTLFNQEDFVAGAGLLTSFTSVAIRDYERVINVASDLAQTNKGAVKDSLLQVAKALNAPSQNLTALSRSGIQFTEQQKEQIKTLEESGRLLEAQQMILTELERQYGGNAKAAATGFAGAVDTLGENFRDFQETLAKGVLPAAESFVAVASQALEALSKVDPVVIQVSINIAGAAAATFLWVKAIKALKATALFGWLSRLVPILAAGKGALAAKAIATASLTKALAGLKLAVAALGGPFTLLAAGVAALGVAFFKTQQEKKKFDELLKSGSVNELNQKMDALKAKLRTAEARLKALKDNGVSPVSRSFKQQQAIVEGLQDQLNQIERTYKVRIDIEQLFNGKIDLSKINSSGFGRNDQGLTYTVGGITYNARTGEPVAKPKAIEIPDPTGGKGKELSDGSKELRNLQQQIALLQTKNDLEKSLLQIRQKEENAIIRIQETVQAGQQADLISLERRKAQLLQLEAIKKYGEDAMASAQALIDQTNLQVEADARRRELIAEGINPALADQLVAIEQNFDAERKVVDERIAELETTLLQADADAEVTKEIKKRLEALKKARGELDKAEGKAKDNAKDNQDPGKIQQYLDQLETDLTDFEGMVVSLAQTIESELASAMSSAIIGIIDGTQTAEEAFANMFKNIGKAFIDMATQMIAKALIMKALGILFPFSPSPVGSQGNPFGNVPGGSFPGGPAAGGGRIPLNFAEGGRPPANMPSLVGENGPELFIPDTPGTIVTNEQTRAQLDMYSPGNATDAPSGPMNVSMNYSGPTMAFDDKRYVPVEAIPDIIKDAAKQGEQRTLASMRNRVSTRNRVGI